MIVAQKGDIILVSCGTYYEADIQIKSGVSLWSGTLRPDCVTIDAGNRGRCLIFDAADSTTSVVGFTLQGGTRPGEPAMGRGGAVLCLDSSPRFTHCVFRANAANQGGALAALGNQGPLIKECRFETNSAHQNGGAIFWSAASGSVLRCVFAANHATISGGGLSGTDGSLAINSCLFTGNSAGNTGGAISLNRTATVLTQSVLSHNSGGLTGGAISMTATSPRITQCTFDANLADGMGSVLYLQQANPALDHCLLTGSVAQAVNLVASAPVLRTTNIYSPAAGNWPDALTDQSSLAGNLSADPLYCGPADGDYHLRSASPCLAPANGGPPIGALGQGCGAQFPSGVVD